MMASLAMEQKKMPHWNRARNCTIGGQRHYSSKRINLMHQKRERVGKAYFFGFQYHSLSQRPGATSKEINEPFGMKPYLCRVWERDSKRDSLVCSPWKRQIQTRRPLELQGTDAALLEVCSPHVWDLNLAVSTRDGACPIRAPMHTGGPRALCPPQGRPKKQMEYHMPT